MRILITGGFGFIGSHLVRHFVALGHEVTAADRFNYATKARRLGDCLPKIRVLIGDLAQGDLPYRCVEVAPDLVIHTAAETHVDRSIMDPTTFLVNNPLGTSRLLDAFAKGTAIPRQPFPRFVIYSTDEVYGPSKEPSDFKIESDPFRPSNAYSASKVAVEAVCHAFRVTHALPIIIVRPCNVYGVGQHPEKAVPKWTRQMLRGEPVTIYNDGRGFRDWMHTHDHCRAIEAIVDQWELAHEYGVLNLPRRDFRTDQQVADAVAAALGMAYEPHRVPGRPGHDHGYAMFGDRLGRLGWEPLVEFDYGLHHAVRHAKAEADFWEHDLVRVPDVAGGYDDAARGSSPLLPTGRAPD